MATIFSHIAVPLAIGLGLGRARISIPVLKLGMLYSILPDLDVLAFRFGIPYESAYGHRGFSHSLAAAAILALAALPWRRRLGSGPAGLFAYLFLAMASHPLLDALTDGGLGVALFWPFSEERIFLPWQVIAVSPIGGAFFSARGWAVLQSELVAIWLPAGVVGLLLHFWLAKAMSKS